MSPSDFDAYVASFGWKVLDNRLDGFYIRRISVVCPHQQNFSMTIDNLSRSSFYPNPVVMFFRYVLSICEKNHGELVGSYQVLSILEKTFKGVKDCKVACPGGCGRINTLLRTVIHLNDYHAWTREKIATWLETLEGVDLNISPSSQGD